MLSEGALSHFVFEILSLFSHKSAIITIFHMGKRIQKDQATGLLQTSSGPGTGAYMLLLHCVLQFTHVPVIKILFHSRIIYSFFQIIKKDVKQNQTSCRLCSQHIALSH